MDASGGLRDLSGIVRDIAGPALAPDSLARLRALDPETLPKLPPDVRLGPCVGGTRNVVSMRRTAGACRTIVVVPCAMAPYSGMRAAHPPLAAGGRGPTAATRSVIPCAWRWPSTGSNQPAVG